MGLQLAVTVCNLDFQTNTLHIYYNKCIVREIIIMFGQYTRVNISSLATEVKRRGLPSPDRGAQCCDSCCGPAQPALSSHSKRYVLPPGFSVTPISTMRCLGHPGELQAVLDITVWATGLHSYCFAVSTLDSVTEELDFLWVFSSWVAKII